MFQEEEEDAAQMSLTCPFLAHAPTKFWRQRSSGVAAFHSHHKEASDSWPSSPMVGKDMPPPPREQYYSLYFFILSDYTR